MFLKDTNKFNVEGANKLITARTINGTSFNGTENITTTQWGTSRNIQIGNTTKSVNGSANVTWSLSEIGAAASSHTHTSAQISDATNANTANMIVKRDSSGNFNAGTITAALSGNASTATKLQTVRTINGTNFDGSANITTANWGTARNIQIGNTSKSVNGSINVTWTLSEIGAAAASHTHSYLPLSGGTLTGAITVSGESKFHNGTYSDPWSGTSCAIKASGHIATTGTLKGSKLTVSGTGSATMQYNNDLDCIDFIFA